jgi:predicted alpha/beta-hydrolase family hydrolase
MSEALDFLHDGPKGAPLRLAFAHGAGAGMRSPFMDAIARGLAARGIGVVRFEFPYMHARSSGGPRRGPDRPDVLKATWKRAVAELGGARDLVIGGKSMGGRIASLVADELGARGLCCLGYPFHPAGKPRVLRTAHLAALRTPTLIVQGTRDALGTRDEVAGYALSPAIRVEWIEDGDHSLAPRKRSGHSAEAALEQALAAISAFMQRL